MPESTLLDAYLERLAAALPLPADECAAAIEEIAAHVHAATDASVARGVPADVAQRRTLASLGVPERLAGDIGAAHRLPTHALAAAGTALRVSVITGLRTFVLAWAAILLVAILLGLAFAGLGRVIGAGLVQIDWSPLMDGLLPALVAGLFAYAIGRGLVSPVALAARRQASAVRIPILVVGVLLCCVIGLTAFEARWNPFTALLMLAMPVWFAAGVMRPNLLPKWDIGPRALAAVVGVLVVASTALLFVGGTVTSSATGSESYDPALEYAHVGPFVSLDAPPIALEDASEALGPWSGPNPVTLERSGTVPAGFTHEWTDVRLEVWPGPPGELNGPVLDRNATAPLATAPMVIEGRRISGDVSFAPLLDRSHYYVAITGLDRDGQRWQLAWPGAEFWQWSGTPLELLRAIWR